MLYRTAIVQTFMLASVVVIAAVIYWPTMAGDFYFDEFPALSGLEQVDDARSALEYVLSGTAGPSGRPLSLAAFLMDSHGWPDTPSVFLRTNVLLHLINGLLLAWFAFRLGRACHLSKQRSGYFAVATSALWMLLPILASAPLMVVQRMTLLSASFVLLGLITFLSAYGFSLDQRRLLTTMAASLVTFTGLAMLAKENGALLPVFILVLTGYVLPKPKQVSNLAWQRWRVIFLWLPAIAVIAVVLSKVPYSEVTILRRDFTAIERLLTQARILWEYLFYAFVPVDLGQLGPFHDDYEPSRSLLEPLTAIAVAAWITTVSTAVVMRHRWPWLAFAVFWYLGGHLLESTLVPLELYFEHRNYLPLIGPVMAIAWALIQTPTQWRRFAIGAFSAYCALMALSLWLVTQQWGDPFRSAQIHYAESPRSSRAAGYLVGHFIKQEWPGPAAVILDQAIERDISRSRFRLMKAALECLRNEPGESDDLETLAEELPTALSDANFPNALYWLVHHYLADCPTVRAEDVRHLISQAEKNPYYHKSRISQYWLHRTRAVTAATDNKPELEIAHLRAASRLRFDPVVLDQLAEIYAGRGDLEVACDLFHEIGIDMPLNPVRRLHQQLALERLKTKWDCAAREPLPQ